MIAVHGPYSIHIINSDDAPRLYPWAKPHRRLTWYLLVCSLSGSERIAVDGRPCNVPAGGSYLVPPGALVDLASDRGNRPVWIHFEVRYDQHRGSHPPAQSYVDDWPARAPIAQPPPADVWGVQLPVLVPPVLTALFRQSVPRVVSLWKQHTPLATMEAHHTLGGLLLALVAHQWRHAPAAPAPDLPSRFARAQALARENLADFRVPQFAAAAGLSRSRFTMLYHQHTGQSPGTFLRQLRMAQAAALLADSSLPIQQIARLVGYPDPTVFARLFHKAHHQTPSSYRATCKRTPSTSPLPP